MKKNDQHLVAAYLSGDESALAEIVDRYLKPIYNFVYRFTGSSGDAEDITQETFLKVWKNLKRYKKGESFKAWIFSIARNTAIDWMRKKKNLAFSDFENEEGGNSLSDILVDAEPLPDAILARAEDQKFVENLLEKLSPKYREVILLHYNNHMTFEEIGQVLKKPLDTVKSQHRRALIELRKVINAPK